MTDMPVYADRWSSWYEWDLRVVDVADGRVLVLSALAGIILVAGGRSGVVTLGGTLAVVIAGILLLASGRMKTWASRACIATAMILSAFLAIRTSEWLVPVDLMGCGALMLLAGVVARDGNLADLPARLLVSRAVAAAAHCVASAGFLFQPLRRTLAPARLRTARAGAVARGLAIAIPIVLLLGALLASADAVFASVFRIHVPLSDNVFAHVVLVIVGALAIGGILRAASASPAAPLPSTDRRLGPVEWTIVLGSVVALFGAFAIAQAVTLAGGANHVLETQGLTYAEYARTGYAQLFAVSVLTGLVLVTLDALASRETATAQRRFVVLAELTIAMTAILLVVAVRRLGLYEDAYGWTMLRLAAKAGAVWLGVVLVLLGARVGGIARETAWFVPASIAAGVAVVLALNLINPEAAVARHNLHDATHEIDPDYLSALADDAVPTIVATLPTLPPERAAALRELVCTQPYKTNSGFLGWNQSARRARDARAKVC
jgi:hypothetical protein